MDSDNGPQVITAEFSTFMKQNGIKHIKCSPYHPSSNGQAERFVRSFKEACENENLSLELTYRTTPHTTTGESQDKLFLGRDLKTR